MITNMPHKSYSKIPRYENQTFTISEKIDGSNGLIYVTEGGWVHPGSRSKWLNKDETKTWDNHGFGAWVKENEDDLRTLGAGFHYGEWYGRQINRNYGLKDRRFMLFNHNRYKDIPKCCEIEYVLARSVPIMMLSDFVEHWVRTLTVKGSQHVPGFMKPEGLIIRNNLTQQLNKLIIDK